MKITLLAKKIELTDDIRSYVDKKIGKLDKYIKNVIESWVELAEDKSMKSGKKFRAEVQIKLPRESIRADVEAMNIFEAIDLVVPKLKKRIEKIKGYKERPRKGRGIKGVRE